MWDLSEQESLDRSGEDCAKHTGSPKGIKAYGSRCESLMQTRTRTLTDSQTEIKQKKRLGRGKPWWSECHTKLAKGQEAMEFQHTKFTFIKHHCGSRVGGGLEVNKVVGRQIQRIIKKPVYDEADSEHTYFCSKETISLLKLLACKTFTSNVCILVEQRNSPLSRQKKKDKER